MHFGKLLRVTTSQMPEVEQILACYKACKKTIKSWPKDACVDVDDSAFVHTLSTHLCTFNRKWEERELACKVRFAALQEQVRPRCSDRSRRIKRRMAGHGPLNASWCPRRFCCVSGARGAACASR